MTKQLPAQTVICRSGQPFQAFYMILKGSVSAKCPDGEFLMEKGDVIGLSELCYNSYLFTYTTLSEATIAAFPYKKGELANLFRHQPDITSYASSSGLRQLKNIIEIYELSKYDCDNLYHYLLDSCKEYSEHCSRYQISPKALPDLEEVLPLTLEEDIEDWLLAYYENMPSNIMQLTSDDSYDFISGMLMKISQDIGSIISVCQMMYDYKSDIAQLLMNSNRLDLFDLYSSLFVRISQNQSDSTSVGAAVGRLMIRLESLDSIDKALYRSRTKEYKDTIQAIEEGLLKVEEHSVSSAEEKTYLSHSLDTILSYADCDDQTKAAFRQAISSFKKMIDKNSTEDDARRIRLEISKLFYRIYLNAFQISLHDKEIPLVVKMFLQFGYVDEDLAGYEYASYLYSIANSLPTDPASGIYSIYDWLKMIYSGKKEPSRNEFDMDYFEYVHEQKVTGKITAATEQRLLTDNAQKVVFEIENMFSLVNKMTFGRVSTFCPVFSEHNVLKDLEKSLVTAPAVKEAVSSIRGIDYGAFARETIYSNPECGVAKEYVNMEILPDIILLPNVGVRGVMWQEIEGKKRATPSRFMVSIFHLEDLETTLTRLTGEFRWEMCKRIQGIRWNDVSDRSLTSEYFEYIQFYKKNNELTPEAKDKLKSAMQKAKNSYKEMFVRDYVTWVLYEGKGSPRLNKVARTILFTHCPFREAVRTRLRTNPLYKDLLDRYEIKTTQKIRHMDNLCQKIRNTKNDIPAEIEGQIRFIKS